MKGIWYESLVWVIMGQQGYSQNAAILLVVALVIFGLCSILFSSVINMQWGMIGYTARKWLLMACSLYLCHTEFILGNMKLYFHFLSFLKTNISFRWWLVVCVLTNTCLLLTHWGQGKMAAILQMTLSKIFLFNETLRMLIKISLKCIPKGPTNNIPALVQIMA